MQHAKPLIDVKDVSFSYDTYPILERVSFSIFPGDYVGVIGPNGGGKTTLLKLLVGLLRPQSGTITWLQTKNSVNEHSNIGYVPQRITQGSASVPCTVEEIVASGLVRERRLFRPLTKDQRAAIDWALSIAEIEPLRRRLIHDLSGGQRQRAYVARALVNKPQLLLLDEPFVGVDITTQHSFYRLLHDLNQKQRLAILFVSHDIDVIAEEVRTVLCLNQGLLCYGNPSILHEPETLERLYGKHVAHIHHHDHPAL